MFERDHVYADVYDFFVVKTENESEPSILTSKFKEYIIYIIFYHIWFIFCILEEVFQMAHKQSVTPPCSLTPTLSFDIELVMYNHYL